MHRRGSVLIVAEEDPAALEEAVTCEREALCRSLLRGDVNSHEESRRACGGE